MNAPAIMEPTFDMDSPAFASDEFRVFEFKVKRCPRVRAHDWTECPFAHPGEKARRRDPRRYAYCGTACPDFRKGVCRRGDACEFAHGVFECWLHPSRYRTQLCTDGKDCARRVCFFAHLPEELRAPDTSGCPQPSLNGRPASPTAPPLPSPIPSPSPSPGGGANMVYGLPQTSMHAQAAAAAASAQQQAATHAAVAALLGANMHTPAQQAAAAILASSGDPTVQALLAATIRQQQDQQNAYARQLQQALAAQAAGALPSVHQLAAAAAAASAVAQARAVQGAGVLMSSFGEIGSSPAYALPEMSDAAGPSPSRRARDMRRSSCPEVNTGGVAGAPSKEALALLLEEQEARAARGGLLPSAGFEQTMEQAFEQLQIEAEVNAARMGEVIGKAGEAAPAGAQSGGGSSSSSDGAGSRSNGTNPTSKPFKPRNPAIENLVANLPRSLSDLALDRHGDFVEDLLVGSS